MSEQGYVSREAKVYESLEAESCLTYFVLFHEEREAIFRSEKADAIKTVSLVVEEPLDRATYYRRRCFIWKAHDHEKHWL